MADARASMGVSSLGMLTRMRSVAAELSDRTTGKPSIGVVVSSSGSCCVLLQ